MRDFIEFLVKQIVTKPEEVSVTESSLEGVFEYVIKVDTEDMGIVIGKEGHTIRSLRNLARAKAIKDNVRIKVDLEEPQNPTPNQDSND